MQKVVFVIESLYLGGAEKSLITVLQNLDYSRYEVDLILFTKGGLFFNQVPAEVTIIQKELPQLSTFNRLRYRLNRLLKANQFHSAQLFWLLVKDRFTVNTTVYDIAIAYNQGFVTYYVSQFINAGKKFTWLNTDYQRAGYNVRFDYPFYQNFNEVVAVSPEAKNSFLQELQQIKKVLKITVIKDFIDKERIIQMAQCTKDVPFLSDKINIVTVGRLAKSKGLYLAIATCKILVNKGYDINWFIVGEGAERASLESLIRENNLSETFFLTGAKENPYPYIKACDIYVQTSLFEGLGLSVIEATVLNKPIVSTNFPSICSIIQDEETGLIAEMNPQKLASKIERLLTDDELKIKFKGSLSKQEHIDGMESMQKIYKLLNS